MSHRIPITRYALPIALLAVGGCVGAGANGGDPADRRAAAPETRKAPVVAGPATGVPTQAADTSRHLIRFVAPAPDLAAAIEAHGGTIELWHEDTELAAVRGLDEDTIARIRDRADVRGVAPDLTVHLPEPPAELPVARASVEASADVDPSAAEAYARQWHLRAIRADVAWEAGFVGAPHVTVAVLDTGIDYTHRDLEDRVDLERSVSFIPGDDELVEEQFPGRHPVTDLHFHGTHVAATIASNGAVGAGVTRSTTLIGVKVLGADGRGPLSGVMKGVAHAVDEGADVINMSLGDVVLSRSQHGPVIDALEAELQRAVDHGLTVVVSAGNDERDLDADPDAYDVFCDAPQAVCVSATGPLSAESVTGPFEVVDAFAAYSNFGDVVDVAAPGGYAAPVWAACSSTSLRIEDCKGEDGMIVGLVGTSMAAPHVSGLAALLVDARGRRPAVTRARLEESGADLGDAGFDDKFGHGRIDVAAAVGIDTTVGFPDDRH